MTMNWQPSTCLEDPQEYLRRYASQPGATGREGKFALIILNQPILIQRRLFENVWKNATYRFCADGGANRLYDLLKTDEERAMYLPDDIRGDFDSLRDSVKEYYESMGVRVERIEEQDSTDFMKCVHLVRDRDPRPVTSTASLAPSDRTAQTATTSGSLQENQGQDQAREQSKNLGVVVLGGIGGRFDQSMSSIHHLYILNRERQATLVADESIIVVLGAGKHEITCNLDIEGPTCGIVPVGSSEATLTTTGLKWDIENWKTSFGTQISTSNALVGSKVTIETNAPVVWTTELRHQ